MNEQQFRVSTNLTLFLRLVFPLVWFVFFGSFALLVLVLKQDEAPMFQNPIFKFGFLSFFLMGATIIYFTFFKLKRVDMSESSFYVTNYFKTFRYTYDSIASVTEINFIIARVVVLSLKEKGGFGKKIRFVSSRRLWDDFFNSHPHLFQHAIKD